MPKKQTYCSPECRDKARAKRQDEATARSVAELQTYGQEVEDALANSGYKCTKCGISAVIDGVRLTVVSEGEKLVAVCTECAGDSSAAA